MGAPALKYFFQTFGCRVNQYETELLRERLTGGESASATEDYETADVCVVNTCTVTREADKDALRLIRRIGRRNPAAKLVVTGCLASRAPEEIRAAAPGALIVGNRSKEDLPAMLGCSPMPGAVGIGDFHGHSRAFIKVQDGCNMSCSYCIIPSVRPAMSSKPIAGLEAEARGLLDRGYREIVLCGIRLGRYLSQDPSGRRVDFVAMLDRLLGLAGDFRIRLSSLEITDITERFLDLFAASQGKLCPSFHLPLQSGSDAVLKRMERWYTAGFYERRIQALKSRCPDAGVFTDVMVGFPGESEGDFDKTVSLLERLEMSGLHVFRFSRREGTPAARYPGQLSEGRLAERSERMRALDARLRAAFAARSVGSRRRVLLEQGGESPEAMTDHFLRVRLDRQPGSRLAWANIVGVQGAVAVAKLC